MQRFDDRYELLDVVAVPEAIPEDLGIEAGDVGTVVAVLDPGRAVSLEVVEDSGDDDAGEVLATVDLRIDGEEPRVVGYEDERD